MVATLEGARPGPTMLLRADMDALPLQEDTGLPFASEVAGAMHACGHDTHVAMLLSAARMLAARRATLAGRIVFMFQPGEEGYHGARVMIEEGLLDGADKPDAAFGIHVGAPPPGRRHRHPGAAPCWPPATPSRSWCAARAATPRRPTTASTRSRSPARSCRRSRR